MEEEKIIDQSVLAEDVASQIKYQFLDFFLVKPLDPIKVKKEFSTPVDYRRGIVLKRPLYYENADDSSNVYLNIKIGDTVIFRDTAGLRFDLLKDSRLLRQYDILGIEK